MKRLLFAFILLNLMPTQAQEKREPAIRVVTSKTHGLFYMLECLIDVPHRSPEMASTLRGRIGDWYPVREALDSWKGHLTSDALSSLRFPPVQGRTPTLGSVLEKVALQSESPEDLADRAAPWLGPEAAQSFRTALLTLAPHYDRYYWPGSQLERRKEEILADLKKGDFELSFSKAVSFYRGAMPTNSQPTLALIPYVKGLLDDKPRTRGHNSGDLQVAEIIVDQTDPARAGVCFHEFLHALWSGQEPTERERWRTSFNKQGLVGRLAYAQLNEGLATAIGNGWFDARVQGKLNPKEWYADPVIAAYARALYPVVKPALDEGRPPTDAELNQMTQVFEQALPDAVTTFDVVAAQLSTVSTRPEVHQARYQNELMRLGPVRFSGVSDWDNPEKNATFTILWLNQGEERNLQLWGWEKISLTELDTYALRRTPKGWELAFAGEQDELFKLLRTFQRDGLSPKG